MEREHLHRAKSLWAALSFVLLAALCLSLPASGVTLPSCLPPATATAKVVSVGDNGVLVLEGHQSAKLEGLLWPGGSRVGVSALRNLIVGHRLVLHAREPKLDRYDRLRVQAVLDGGRWLQQDVLRRGIARVSVAPDRPECTHELYAAEAEARGAGVGLWANSTYRVRSPQSLRWQDLGTFQIVEGQVLSAKVSGGRGYLDFGRNWRTDFTVTIAPDDMKHFKAANIDPYGYAGKNVRVRGWIDRLHGFEIEANSPAQIEVLK